MGIPIRIHVLYAKFSRGATYSSCTAVPVLVQPYGHAQSARRQTHRGCFSCGYLGQDQRQQRSPGGDEGNHCSGHAHLRDFRDCSDTVVPGYHGNGETTKKSQNLFLVCQVNLHLCFSSDANIGLAIVSSPRLWKRWKL